MINKTDQVNLERLAKEYTWKKIQSLSGDDLMDLLIKMEYLINYCASVGVSYRSLGDKRFKDNVTDKILVEETAYTTIIGLIHCRIREELEPFGEDSAEPDDLDETGWSREVNCRTIQELLSKCYWFAINPLPALRRRHSNYNWTFHRLADEGQPARLAETILHADFVFAAYGPSPEMGYVIAVEEPCARRFRRVISGSLKDHWAVKEARKLMRQQKQKFVQLQEGER